MPHDESTLADIDPADVAPEATGGFPLSPVNPVEPPLVGDDLRTLDGKLRRIDTIHKTWGLPELPDTVKLDLATSPGVDGAGVTDFLVGLSRDVTGSFAQFFPETPRGVAEPLFDQPNLGSPFDEPVDGVQAQVRRAFTDVAGLRKPEALSAGGVQDFKRRAVRHGLLPPDTPIDGRWDPGFNALRGELMNEEFEDRLSGNRTGAVSIDRIARLADDWLNPAALIHAATELDFLPDVGEIVEETKGWMGRIKNFIKKPTPQRLIRALGPVDDIAVPIFNDLLLLTGISEAYTFARVSKYGVEAAQGLYRSKNLARVTTGASRLTGSSLRAPGTLADDVARFSQPSFFSTALQRSNLGFLNRTGQAMEKWRGFHGVRVAKKQVQIGMRLGITARAENLLFPDSEFTDGITSFQHFRTANPLVAGIGDVFDLALTPPTIFRPGLVSDVTKKAGELRRRVSNVPNNTRLSIAAHRGVEKYMDSRLAGLVPGSDDSLEALDSLERFQTTTKTRGPKEAFKEFFNLPDDEDAGHFLSFVALQAAFDVEAAHAAKESLGVAAATTHPNKWRRNWLQLRSKKIAQARHVDEEDLRSWAYVQAVNDTAGPGQKRVLLYQRYLREAGESHEAVLASIRQHNASGVGHINTHLEKLNDDVLSEYMAQWVETFGDWHGFTETTAEIQRASLAGHLDDAKYLKIRSLNNRALGLRPKARELVWGRQLLEEDPDLVSRYFSPLARDIDPGLGRFAAVKPGTPTKGDALAWAAIGSDIKRARGRVRFLEANADLVDSVVRPLVAKAQQEGKLLHEISDQVTARWLGEIIGDPGLITDDKRGIVGLLKWSSKRHVPLRPETVVSDLRRLVDQETAEFAASPGWHVFETPDGLDLRGKIAHVKERASLMAADIDPEDIPEDLRQILDVSGYKLVHGVEFLMPADVLGASAPFADITRSTLHRRRLGMFFGGKHPQATRWAYDRKLRSEVMAGFARLAKNGQLRTVNGTPLTLNWRDLDSPDIGGIIERLYKRLNDARSIGVEAMDNRGVNRWLYRFWSNLSSGTIPRSVSELDRKVILNEFAEEFGEPVAKAIVDATRRARQLGFQERGLVAIEDHLRANSLVIDGLKVLGRTRLPSDVSRTRRAISLTGGAAVRSALGATAAGTFEAVAGENDPFAAAAFGAGAFLSPVGFRRLHRLAENSTWHRYSRTADWLANLRDYMRFTLNPVLDIQRYTEGGLLAATAALPAGVQLSPFTSLSRSAKRVAKRDGVTVDVARRRLLDQFQAASKGDFDPDALESTQRWFTQRGMAAYNPTSFQAGTYADLIDQGMDPVEAYDKVKSIYHYATTGGFGRSPAELSVNFVFFPFSFQKKVILAMTKFLSKDMSRAIVLHDMLKTYEVLSEEYDLSELWEEHLPVLGQLQKLNAFAFGLSPGELGGINRPLIDFFLNAPLSGDAAQSMVDATTSMPILNMFLPQGVTVRNRTDAENLQKLVSRQLPLQRNMDSLLDDLRSQGHVLFSESHLTEEAEVTKAWDEWTMFRDSVDQVAKENGLKGYLSVSRSENPALQPLRDLIEQKKAELALRYPTWAESKARVITKRVEQATDLQAMVARGRQGASQLDVQVAQFADFVDGIEGALQEAGVSPSSNPEDIPMEVQALVREQALRLASQGQGFDGPYRRFWMRSWGPISVEF